VRSRRRGSPLLPCWSHFFGCSIGYSWLSGLWVHIAGSCLACHPPLPPGHFWQGCIQSFHPLDSIVSGGCLDPDLRPCIWICWTSWHSRGPTAQAYVGLSGWHPVPRACQLYHMAWCHPQTCRECTWSPCQCLMKMLKSTSPSNDPWGVPLITYLHLNIEALTTTIWVWSRNQFLIHQTVHPSDPYVSTLERMSWKIMSKALLKSR